MKFTETMYVSELEWQRNNLSKSEIKNRLIESIAARIIEHPGVLLHQTSKVDEMLQVFSINIVMMTSDELEQLIKRIRMSIESGSSFGI